MLYIDLLNLALEDIYDDDSNGIAWYSVLV